MEQARRSRRPTSDRAILRGHPLPLGATVQPDGINFAIASRYATAVTLLIFLPGTREPLLEVPLDARFHPTEAIIYELHVRGFTQHISSGVSRPGTFAGLVEKIPYLQALGVNVVELMPVWAFEEADSDRLNPCTGEHLLNYWGYHPIT